MLAREQPSGPAEAGGDLVEDQQHVVALAQSLDVVEVFRRVEPHAPGALDDGLEDHRGDFGVVFGQERLHAVDIVRLEGLAGSCKWPVGEELSGENRPEPLVHAGHRIANAHRAEGVAVVAAPDRG